MYLFNKITVNPQLPDRIKELSTIANNVWWAWNTDFLKLFKTIDVDLWENCGKNPVKFLKIVDQVKLESVIKYSDFLDEYDRVVSNFKNYIDSKNTWYNKNYPNEKNNLIAYFSAEYGLDEILPIYSGGLGILSGDHLKSASDLGLPFVAVGLLYKNGYFGQKINGYGNQESEYKNIDISDLPILPVKTENGEDLYVDIKFGEDTVYLKVWQIKVGRISLYLMDSDNERNKEEYKDVTLRLYGGDQEMRIRQEIVLGMAGVKLLSTLGLNPTVYHMNEGHSSFLVLELIKNIMNERQVSFEIAKDIVTAKTVFTTHTPVPAGNDMFPIELVEKYFRNFWGELGLTREEFLKLGMKPTEGLEAKFNMGILALKIAGKKNGVSKLHGAVSRELFGDVWPNIAANESPIGYVTNGVHTCSWLAFNIKDLYNEYLDPYWQDDIHVQETWNKIEKIPNRELWAAHKFRKERLMQLIKENVTERLKRNGMSYEQIKDITSKINPNALTIGFARRFATYKRATLIFKDIERITQILNDSDRPVQLVFAGKAHPADKEGQDLIRYINEISLMPQFKGKIFLLENYNMNLARYLVSGVDVWLNNPRRPMEASGTSGQKASINGVINLSILDGWWAEGYNMKNGWAIGTNATYDSYESQDVADSDSLYYILEHKVIPMYYKKDADGVSEEWVTTMKNSIISTGAKYSTSRMVIDYVQQLYMPLCNLTNNYFNTLEKVTEYNEFKNNLYRNWKDIEITQINNFNNITINAREEIDVVCEVKLPNISPENIETQVYFGRVMENGVLENIGIVTMDLIESNDEERIYKYNAKVKLSTGGDYGYTFRVMPKHEMLLDNTNLNLVKWITA